MQLEDMNKKDLLEKINVLNRQIAELKKNARQLKTIGRTRFWEIFNLKTFLQRHRLD